jgi:hypothetical protein
MCCFSQPVELVRNTNIFARSANGRQFLVYSMTYAARQDLAMVLPLPVPPNPPEDAVRFINLERYPAFFDDMRSGFPALMSLSRGVAGAAAMAVMRTLQVHEVGQFEASFVPRLDDFDRLDERFRIPRDVWDRLPAYHDYGFAVFKLKGDRPPQTGFLRKLLGGGQPKRPPGRHQVHPMAFEFPRRNPDLLYFPTVHVHDRQVHSSAYFDHMLYCQAGPGLEDYLDQDWEPSTGPAAYFMKVEKTEGIVDPRMPCWRQPLQGNLTNRDALVGKGGSIPEFAAV